MQDDYSAPVDLNLMANALAGNMTMLRKLIEHMIGSYPSQLKAIENSITAGNAPELRRIAHTFKGSISNFQARAAVDLAFQLEKCGADGELKSAPDILKKLEEEMRHIQNYLEHSNWEADLGNAP